MNSGPVFTGIEGCTSITKMLRLIVAIGAMSRRNTNGRFL
jgi:hypothetical protein